MNRQTISKAFPMTGVSLERFLEVAKFRGVENGAIRRLGGLHYYVYGGKERKQRLAYWLKGRVGLVEVENARSC